MKLWLDDVREPWKYGYIGVHWVKTAEEAIAALQTGGVEWVSLDHDLDWEHYPGSGVKPEDYKQKTGYAVVKWMEENNVWPPKGVQVHSLNPEGRARMEAAIRRSSKRRP